MMTGKTPQILTFGCRLNAYESEVMRSHATAAGLNDVVIVNTCAVTAEAERQALQSIRKLRRELPDAKIFVTGCAAQINPEKYAELNGVAEIIGNENKLKAETWQNISAQAHQNTAHSLLKPLANYDNIQNAREAVAHSVKNFSGKWRGFVQVQNGCDHRCTFCIIPFGRGPSRSVPIGGIVDQVRELVLQGYNEISFTGVDITAYGADLPGQPSLGQMARRVLALVPELKRLRLSSLDPVEVDEDLWHLLATEKRLMPHLHISMQSGDDMILKRMKRRHNRQDLIDFCTKARQLRPNIVFGADIIAGFPTETDDMFQNTLALVQQLDLTWLHVFPYSARKGTPAAKMPQIKGDIRKARAALLRQAGEVSVLRHLERFIGHTAEIMVEQTGIGRTETFAEVKIPADLLPGSIATVTCIHLEDGRLVAK